MSVPERLLLRAYPRWFRDEFGDQLEAHMAHQRPPEKAVPGWRQAQPNGKFRNTTVQNWQCSG